MLPFGESFVSTLEDVLNIMTLSLYGETNAISSTLIGEHKGKLPQLTEAASSTESSYARGSIISTRVRAGRGEPERTCPGGFASL